MIENSSRSGRLLQWLLVWTALTTLVFWLPAVRGVCDGDSYRWHNFGFSGRGVSGDYWFPITATCLALATQYLAWRGPRAPFYVPFAGWHLFLALGVLSIALTEPAALRFRGDSLGIDVSIAVAAPVLFGIGAALAIFWIVRDVRSSQPRPALLAWSPRNTRWIIAMAALLPVQFVLLRFGQPDGTADQIGVLLTISQWLLLSVGLRFKS